MVYEVRAFWEDAAVDLGTSTKDGSRYRLTREMESTVLRRCDAITTICEGLRGEIVGRGSAPGKVTVIPNAVDAQEFAFHRDMDTGFRQQQGLDGKTVIGFIGSWYAYEGLDLLLRALPQALKARPDLAVLLVGGGPAEEKLRALARELDLDPFVRFVGRVPHGEVGRYYDLVDLLVYPRHSMRLTELVTPLKPLEAMARGRVVLASDVGGHRELLRHDDTGFSSPPIMFRDWPRPSSGSWRHARAGPASKRPHANSSRRSGAGAAASRAMRASTTACCRRAGRRRRKRAYASRQWRLRLSTTR